MRSRSPPSQSSPWRTYFGPYNGYSSPTTPRTQEISKWMCAMQGTPYQGPEIQAASEQQHSHSATDDPTRPAVDCVPVEAAAAALGSESQTAPRIADRPDRRSSAEWLQSLRLWHHYTTQTCYVLPRSKHHVQVWKTAVLEAAHSHAFLMDGMLAIAASHYAFVYPQHRNEYTLISMEYQTRAIEWFATRLDHMNDDNCDAYFFLACVIFMLSLCSIAQSGSMGVTITCSDIAQSLSLLQGIRGILDYKPIERWPAENTELAILFRNPRTAVETRIESPFSARLDTINPLLDTLPQGLEVMNTRSVCLLALDTLRTTHRACKNVQPDEATVWRWPFTLPPSFLGLISGGQPVALIILAHFAALVRSYEHVTWSSKGWGINVMLVVERALGQEWQAWIEWPKYSLKNEIDIDSMDLDVNT
ncbi:hypothetical protein PFICI_02471 [Pestalotiopsis fici W106-1]|uniref:Transcription factor domain-containing protein n=1 Tax=Pestalotiopsis fici (strain W106-1 / CGMCC3.15140) TaxID=1229662 RepID=W3XGU5_PESFW|nr:uncharacterized protein PFICI_02471 [Pestalotiopsis fici W106-1]ETS84446.1 hypothetical protein PFICI_02471 [Pestalotiopsis fici W106-1]